MTPWRVSTGDVPSIPPPSLTLPARKLAEPMKSATNWLFGLAVDVLRRAALDDLAEIEHRDLVGQRQRLGLVVGDVDGGDAEPLLQALELDPHLLAQLGVEIGQRLVEQQDLRLAHQAAREGEPLLLAAGKLRGGPLSRSRSCAPFRARAPTLSLISAVEYLRSRATRSGKATFSNTVMCGQIA